MDGIAINICPSRYPRFAVLRCLDFVDLPPMATDCASGTPGSAPGAGAPPSSRVPVLRLNFMSKCYLIGYRLQQRVVDRVCIVRATTAMQPRPDMCSVHICVQWRGGFRHLPAHDEFSGTPKVSL